MTKRSRRDGRAARPRSVARAGAVARALGGAPVLIGVAVSLVVVAVVPDGPVEVIGRVGVQAMLWPLAPVVLAAAVPASTTWLDRPLERTARRSSVGLAARHLAVVAAAASLLVIAVPEAHRIVVARNVAGLVGLGLLAARALPLDAAWAPVVGLAAATWLFGTEVGGRPRSWALLLAPPGHTVAAVTAVVIAAVAVSTHLAAPALPHPPAFLRDLSPESGAKSRKKPAPSSGRVATMTGHRRRNEGNRDVAWRSRRRR